jgi:hypothetical protein
MNAGQITTMVAIAGFLIQLGFIVFYFGRMDVRVSSLEFQNNEIHAIVNTKVDKEVYYRDRSEILITLKELNIKLDKVIDLQLSRKETPTNQ